MDHSSNSSDSDTHEDIQNLYGVSSMFQPAPKFDYPKISFDESPEQRRKSEQGWNQISGNILNPFVPQYPLYDYKKYVPEQIREQIAEYHARSTMQTQNYQAKSKSPTLKQKEGQNLNSSYKKSGMTKSAIINLKRFSMFGKKVESARKVTFGDRIHINLSENSNRSKPQLQVNTNLSQNYNNNKKNEVEDGGLRYNYTRFRDSSYFYKPMSNDDDEKSPSKVKLMLQGYDQIKKVNALNFTQLKQQKYQEIMSYKKIDINHRILIPLYNKTQTESQRRHSVSGYDYLSLKKINQGDEIGSMFQDQLGTKIIIDEDAIMHNNSSNSNNINNLESINNMDTDLAQLNNIVSNSIPNNVNNSASQRSKNHSPSKNHKEKIFKFNTVVGLRRKSDPMDLCDKIYNKVKKSNEVLTNNDIDLALRARGLGKYSPQKIIAQRSTIKIPTLVQQKKQSKSMRRLIKVHTQKEKQLSLNSENPNLNALDLITEKNDTDKLIDACKEELESANKILVKRKEDNQITNMIKMRRSSTLHFGSNLQFSSANNLNQIDHDKTTDDHQMYQYSTNKSQTEGEVDKSKGKSVQVHQIPSLQEDLNEIQQENSLVNKEPSHKGSLAKTITSRKKPIKKIQLKSQLNHQKLKKSNQKNENNAHLQAGFAQTVKSSDTFSYPKAQKSLELRLKETYLRHNSYSDSISPLTPQSPKFKQDFSKYHQKSKNSLSLPSEFKTMTPRTSQNPIILPSASSNNIHNSIVKSHQTLDFQEHKSLTHNQLTTKIQAFDQIYGKKVKSSPQKSKNHPQAYLQTGRSNNNKTRIKTPTSISSARLYSPKSTTKSSTSQGGNSNKTRIKANISKNSTTNQFYSQKRSNKIDEKIHY